MPNIHISHFSCLDDVAFSLSPVNILIGPQGSGKSVTTKLFYFLTDVCSNFVPAAERGDSIEAYKKLVARRFAIWFPPAAWGEKRFIINYGSGNFSIRVMRRRSQSRLSDDVAITFSDRFVTFFQESCDLFAKAAKRAETDRSVGTRFALEGLWRTRELLERKLTQELDGDYVASQTFIPAGRAFFTSIGSLVAGFDQAGNLDPVTIQFAKLFLSLKDRNARLLDNRLSRLSSDFREKRKLFMSNLIGGQIKFDNDLSFVETSDGRRIPFASLSSGQQELLPMWTLMDYFTSNDAFYRDRPPPRSARRAKEVVYIEEPEAHLFPSAQSVLLEYLIGSVMADKFWRSMVITTHSPYIMSKLNLFLKAAQLARRKKRNQDINTIIPRECWLSQGSVAAYAIENGRLRDLLDEEGLIDSSYLDSISEDISDSYSALLQIESEIR